MSLLLDLEINKYFPVNIYKCLFTLNIKRLEYRHKFSSVSLEKIALPFYSHSQSFYIMSNYLAKNSFSYMIFFQ